jgi:hypothetical protein
VIRDGAQRLPDQAVVPREISRGVSQVRERGTLMNGVGVAARTMPALRSSADGRAFVMSQQLLRGDPRARARELLPWRDEPDRAIEQGRFLCGHD